MRTIKLLLTIAGCAALFIGVALAAVATSPLLTASVPDFTTAHSAIYVGVGTCVTCHEDGGDNWTHVASTRLVENTIRNPRAPEGAAVTSELAAGSLNRSAVSGRAPAITDMSYQQYVLLTEMGYLVLPGHWRVGDQWYFMPPGSIEADSSESCSDCHTDEFSALFRVFAAKAPPATRPSAPPVLHSQARLTFTEEQIL